jgi:glycosyltransferase involved in cell wall biosynthesis
VGKYENDFDPLEPETNKQINEHSKIVFAGYQQDVRPFFAMSDALVFPSYREGFPNVVMQAGAMGLPSIVTDINGCNEIIEEGENGLIIQPKNSEELKQKMEVLVSNSELLKRLGNNSRKMITDRYKRELIWEALLLEYQSLILNK